MLKFKAIATFVTNAVTKYKAQRVRDVISQYRDTVDTQVTIVLPVITEFYKNVATSVVDKTFEDPKPALQLIEALDAVTKHYGPALSDEFEAFSTKLEERGASPVVTKRIEALLASIDALNGDRNDH